MVNSPNFGDLLNKYLQREERSANWLAQKVDVNRSTIGRWLAGSAPGAPDKILLIGKYLHLRATETNGLLVAADFPPISSEETAFLPEAERRTHPVVENALRELNSTDPALRDAAISTLRDTDHPSALRALCDAVKHPTVDVRRAAVQALQRFAGRTVFKTLEAAVIDTDPQVRAAAVSGLRGSDLLTSRERVLSVLHDGEADVLVAALGALLNNPAFWQDTQAIKPLMRFWGSAYTILNYFNRTVQALKSATIATISKLGETAIDPILELVEESKDANPEYKLEIHQLACETLAAIGSPRAREAYVYFTNETNYGNYLEFEVLRAAAALALAKLGDWRAGPPLIAARAFHWTEKGPIPYVLVPDDGVYRDKYTKALQSLGYPHYEDPHEEDNRVHPDPRSN